MSTNKDIASFYMCFIRFCCSFLNQMKAICFLNKRIKILKKSNYFRIAIKPIHKTQ